MPRGFIVLSAGISLVLAVACSSESGEPQTAGVAGSGERITCESDARDIYVANLEKPGRGGVLKFVLAESSPAPPSRGRNVWTMKVLDQNGMPLAGAKIVLRAFMPAHGHSSPTVPTVTPGQDSYSVGPISLFMPGLWEVTVEVEVSGVRDSAVFAFCVAG